MAVRDAGAEVVEINLSCETCAGLEQAVYKNPALAARICQAIRKAEPNVKLIAKIGYLTRGALTPLLRGIGPSINAIAGINAVPTEGVVTGEDAVTQPTWRIEGEKGGFSGRPVRALALEFLKNLSALQKQLEEANHLAILGMGGLTDATVAPQFLKFADLALAGTAFLDDSYFGVKVRHVLASDWQAARLSSQRWKESTNRVCLKAIQELHGTAHPDKKRSIADAGLQVLNEQEALYSTSTFRNMSEPTLGDMKELILKRLPLLPGDQRDPQ